MNDEPAQPARARRAHPRPVTGSRVKRASDFLNLKLETRVRLLEEMTTLECAQLFHDWAFWARPEQAPPDGNWIIWLILAGRGAGKARPSPMRATSWSGANRAFSPAAGATSVPAFSPLTFDSNGRTAR